VYSFHDHVCTIMEFLEHVGWMDGNGFDLIGHSMGASKIYKDIHGLIFISRGFIYCCSASSTCKKSAFN
jgi:hypothetical protein